MTYKELVNYLLKIIGEHLEVQHTAWGWLSDLKAESQKYPYIYLLPDVSTKANKTIKHSFQLIAMDIVNVNSPHPDKELITQNRMIQIILDILSELEWGNNKFTFVRNNSFRTFVEKDQDFVAGATIDITIELPLNPDYCEIPLEDDVKLSTTNLFNIVQNYRLIANKHKLINSFYYGELSDIKWNELEQTFYPYFFIKPQNHLHGNKIINWNFTFFLMDIVKKKKENDFNPLLNVISSQMSTLFDIIIFMERSETFKNTDFNKNFTIIPFVERFPDEVSGIEVNISLTTPTPLNKCDAPI